MDEFTCIGCKNCCNVCPKSFGLEDVFGRARVFNQKGDVPDKLQEAIDTCPVSCIHWVTAPQLTLLESAMAKIERVSAYLLMMGCGRATDVFQVISLKREILQQCVHRKPLTRLKSAKQKCAPREIQQRQPVGWTTLDSVLNQLWRRPRRISREELQLRRPHRLLVAGEIIKETRETKRP